MGITIIVYLLSTQLEYRPIYNLKKMISNKGSEVKQSIAQISIYKKYKFKQCKVNDNFLNKVVHFLNVYLE